MSSSRRLLEYLFIVPEAHVKLGEFQFQAEMYAVFHRKWGSRIGHMVCTPLVMTGLFALLAMVPVAPLDAFLGSTPIAHGLALPAALVLFAWFVSIDRLAALLLTPFIALTLVGAQFLLNVSGPHALRNALILTIAAAFGQALSHAVEEIPPPWTGSYRWTPFVAWVRQVNPLVVVAVIFALSTIYSLLELWASPRVWLLQMINAMFAFGYRPELKRSLRQRVPEILEDSRNGWGPEFWAKVSASRLARSVSHEVG